MNGDYVCTVCLSKNDLDIVFQKENVDLLTKLRLVGGIPIVKDELLPQCICRGCSHELQLAHELMSQYEATYVKFTSALRSLKNVSETRSIIGLLKKEVAENVQMGVPADLPDSFLTPEIVVKEELFPDDDEEIHTSECKAEADRSELIDICVLLEVDGSDGFKVIKMSGLDSENSLDVKCSERLNDRHSNIKVVEELDMFSDDELSVISYAMSDETIDPDESSKLLRSNKGISKWAEAACKARTSKNTNQNCKGDEINTCDIVNKRFHANDQGPRKSLFEDEARILLLERLELAKLNTAATSASRKKVNECANSLEIGHLTYSCDKCGERFTEKISMMDHQMLHSDPDAFKCDQCGNRYSRRYILNRHKAVHSKPRLFACEKCERKFKRWIDLKEHKKMHLNPFAVECNECDRTFSSKENFVRHLKTHSNPKPHACNKCGKEFSESFNMKEHYILHSNPNAFKCKRCDKRLSTSKILKHHKCKI